MPLTPHEEAVLTTLEDELRAEDPALAAALASAPPSPSRSGSRPRGRLREEFAAEWDAFSPAIRAFFLLLPVGLVLSVAGAAVGLLWMTMLGTLVFLGATGCTVCEARARRSARGEGRSTRP